MVVRIVLADDHPIFRRGLLDLLEAEPDFQVIGEAADGGEVVELVQRLQPAVLVLDLMMPGLNGLEVIQQVRKQSQETHIVILSLHANEGYVLEALRAGAMAYVLKEAADREVIQAIRQVVSGKRYLSAVFSERAIEIYSHKAESVVIDPYDMLSAREKEVLQLAAEGHTSAEIAARLFISPRTVEAHRARLMSKLKLHGPIDLIRYALRRGILPMEP